MKPAYLSDIFQKLNELNLQMQHTPSTAGRLNHIILQKTGDVGAASERGGYRFIWELEIIHWGQQSAEHSDPMYENSYPCPTKTFPEVFPSAGSCKIGVDPRPLQCNTSCRRQRRRGGTEGRRQGCSWSPGHRRHSGLEWKRMTHCRAGEPWLLPLATSYLCEICFSAVASVKTKYRSKLNIENELRVAVSQLCPRFEKICPHQSLKTLQD